MTSYNDVGTHLRRLEAAVYPDSYPSVQASSCSIQSQSICNLHFADDKLYAPYQHILGAYLVKEGQIIAQLLDNLELGQKMLSILYTYRSVARAIPQAQNQLQANRSDLYKTAYGILKPEIQKIKDIHKYSEALTSLIAMVIRTLVPEYRENAPSLDFLHVLGKTMDLVLTIDMVKNAKASLNNDFSMYKRILSNLKNLAANVDDETLENHALYSFLGTQNIFALKLREKLAQVQGWEEIVVDMVHQCAEMFDENEYVFPEEKHTLLKESGRSLKDILWYYQAMAFGLYLLDQEGDEKDIFKRKRLRLDRIIKSIKGKPIVPLFGDMTFKLSLLYTKSPKLREIKWEVDANDENLMRMYSLSYQIQGLRATYQNHLRALALCCRPFPDDPRNTPVITASSVFGAISDAVMFVSDLCARVWNSSWKFSCPTSKDINPNCPEDASLYELAVRYNYSTEDRAATVECIAMMKSLAETLLHLPPSAVELLQQHMFCFIQNFVSTTLRDMFLYVSKKKRASASLVAHIILILGEKMENLGLSGNKSAGKDSNPIDPRSISVALTQLYYARSLLHGIVNDRAKGMQGGFLKDKDFKETHVVEVQGFLHSTSYFPYLLDLQDTVTISSDLSELWYKEFYLELTKQIQFPIEMSLPWILADHVIESEDPSLLEFMFYPLDIYNDAANRALHKLRCRYLYDEIQAEVNLCFDQFMWKLSKKVFTEFKTRAASITLDKAYRKDLEMMMNISPIDIRFDMENLPFESILLQSRIQILGRSICITKLISQFCNQHLRQSIDTAIARYESSDLTGIVELGTLMQCAKLTHSLLSEFLTLDPFEDIVSECDEEISLVTFNGRMVSHTIHEILNDLLAHFTYNTITKRFVRRTVVCENEPVQRPGAPKALHMHLYGSKHLSLAHSTVHQLYKGFFGQEHLRAMISLLGGKHIPVICNEILKSLESSLKFIATPYIRAVAKGLPHSTKLPPFEYGLLGSFEYFQVILKPILSYGDLKKGVFQVFQEIGNGIALFDLLESVLFQVAAVNDLLKISLADTAGADDSIAVARTLSKVDHLLCQPYERNALELLGQRTVLLECSHSCFLPLRALFTAMSKIVKELHWEDDLNEQDLHVDHSTEFCRIWSSILFCFALNSSVPESATSRECYGDGVLWSGMVFVYLLGESGRFTAFDFLNHVLQMSSADKKPITKTDLQTFIEYAGFIVRTNQMLLDYFETVDDQNKQ